MAWTLELQVLVRRHSRALGPDDTLKSRFYRLGSPEYSCLPIVTDMSNLLPICYPEAAIQMEDATIWGTHKVWFSFRSSHCPSNSGEYFWKGRHQKPSRVEVSTLYLLGLIRSALILHRIYTTLKHCLFRCSQEHPHLSWAQTSQIFTKDDL